MTENVWDDDKLELLSYLLSDEDEAISPAATITPRPNADERLLSFAQERMWFLEQLKPGTPAYHIVGALRMCGTLDVAALERGLNAVVQRHDALRTTLATVDGHPQQVVAETLTLALPVVDLREQFSETAADAPDEPMADRLHRSIHAEVLRPFSFEQGPLLRATLFWVGPDEHVLALCMHHLISDGWSMSIFFRELGAFYEAQVTSEPCDFDPLPIQYADFAHWQRECLQGDVRERELAYWTERLSGSSLVLDLPTDRPRPARPSLRGGHRTFVVPEDLVDPLRDLSVEKSATLFMTLLAAFQTLLYRYTRQPDILVGTPVANRGLPEIEGLIGPFINTLVLRSDFSPDLSFLELLTQVRETALAAYQHQDLPFELLVDALHPERDLVQTPIFQVMFVFQNLPDVDLTLPGLTISSLPVETGTAKFDLILTVEERDGELLGILEYNADIFDPATIDRLGAHYLVLLEGIVADPAQRVVDLPLLTAAERRQLLDEWNPPPPDLPTGQYLHRLFDAQVERTPDAIAVTFEGLQLTYRQLNQRANQLAHYLQRLDVGPDTLVGLCLDRSLETVVAILGVLKAGGAYLPLDLAYPAERLAFILEDAAAPMVLTLSGLVDHLPTSGCLEDQLRTVCLDADWDAIAACDDGNPESAVETAHMAYVIYTSGSTGKPKGVMVTHANVPRLFDATFPWYEFDARDVWTLFHSYAFDFSVWELWGALLYGGRLVLVPFDVSRAPETFYRLLARERVTVLNQTPPAFRQLLGAEQDALDLQAWSRGLALRYVIFGGEALELQSLRPWFERHGDSQPLLVNMYGITETTVHVTYRPVDWDDLALPGVSPIGRPIPDLQIYVLDEQLHPVPVGVPGEVYVGGTGLARGYLNRPGLTAERFVCHPFSQEPGARLYKTGDLACYRPGGELVYVGRNDHQVKVRGFRIELGEIEAALAKHPAVRETVVITRDDRPGDVYLTAYAVLNPGEDASVTDLRMFLKPRLPEYMVPAAFVLLPEFPLTASGKIDRRALPAPGSERPDLEAPYVMPETSIEKALAAVWSEALGVEQVGVYDNFFALGGDSIRSVRVLALARARGLAFSLETFFQHQTIADLAQEIERARGRAPQEAQEKEQKQEQIEEKAPDHPPTAPFSLISPADRARLPEGLIDAYPLSALQAGMLYHMALTPDDPVYHNVDSFHLRAPLDIDVMREAVQAVVARHPVLRTSFDLTAYSEPLQLLHPHAVLPITMEDLRHLPRAEQDEEIQAYVAGERVRLFDLKQPPLIRFHIHRRTNATFQFTLTECHAIFDGWSLTSTLAEIFDRYVTMVRGAAPPADRPLVATFRDFVRLEKEAVESPACRDYWSRQLAGASPLALPLSPRPLDDLEGRRMQGEALPVPDDVVAGLNRLVQRASVPLKSILLAAHVKAMGVISGQSDVLTGLVSNGRPETPDGDQVRGLFLNTPPFRFKLRPGTWTELVQAVFDAEREMLPFRRYPLAMLQKAWGEQPLLPVTFNFVHFHALEDLSGQEDFEILELSAGTNDNHFDLAVSFSLNQTFWSERAPILLMLQYDGEKFSADQVQTWGAYYLETLRAIASTPQAHHETFSPLTREEKRTLLEVWSGTSVDRADGRDQTVPDLFEACARRAPHATAVVWAGGSMTYRELDRRANRLAHHLQRLDVGPEVPVGICAERSAELIVGALGVLKAGGAYLPLDPAYPEEHLAFVLADVRAPVLLAQEHLLDRLQQVEAQVVSLSDEKANGANVANLIQQPDQKPARALAGENLAYVIYTSGSTGRPKGVQVQHDSLVNLCAWHRRAYGVTAADRATQLASPAFDASVWEIWPYLTVGASLYIPPEAVRLSPPQLLAWLATHEITVSFMPTPLAEMVLEALDAGALGSAPGDLALQQLLTGGDRLRHWPGEDLGFEVVNNYGPTENTVVATWTPVQANGRTEGLPPIGRPVDNVRVYVLDDLGQPVPVGVPGELYIGGANLARGYLNHPGLTAELFVPDPYTEGRGERGER
ncbi:MAG TPA: amino acid adenylation domain-containing protein, partial [Chloroflexi bacterium]|nr:amino acid adenylation domain-containing protein [Chloroflexota bacterium]